MEAALAIIPLFIIMIIYLVVIGLIIWFAITFLNRQKERNLILKEISNKLSNIEVSRKEDVL